MALTFECVTDYPRGTLYRLLADAYAYDPRNAACWDAQWREFDDFFYNNPHIAAQYGFITALDGEPIGMISWDPRHSPAYVEIGHNCIVQKHKGNGYGKLQLTEALRRIKAYPGLRKIIVETNSNLIAPRNYQSAGFKLCSTRRNQTETAHSGDYLLYEIIL